MTQTLADNTVTTRIPRQLIESDTHGKGAAEIGWNSPGDWARCKAFLRRHGVPGHMLDGACANLHKLATGEWPGPNAHKGAHALVLDYLIASMGTYDPILWEGPLARIESPTGDRRQFPRDTLTYQSFPQPLRWQKQGMQGHNGAVTVGVIRGASERDVDATMASRYNIEPGRYVWGNGYFLDPGVISEVNEAVHQVEHGVAGPSVDLDSFTAVLSKTLAGETVANMKRGRQRAATLVSVPAFADLRIKITRPKTLVASITDFAVNPGGWRNAPIAPREALFDADDAAKRIEAWANGDPDKMAKMFLWINTENGPLLGRQGYRLPWGDIIDDKPYLIFHAVYAAAALLQDAHGGLPNIPDDEKGKLRSIITQIYEELATEYDDPSIMAPWDRQAQAEQQQASGQPQDDDWFEETGEYADYMYAHTAALEEFVTRHRYTEWKHPRDKRRNKHAGEWRDVPKHDAHGRIKVGSKWVYPPKKGEKGYRNPESAVKGIAKRGGGSGGAKRAPSTHVVKKASPDKGSGHHKAPEPSRPAAPHKEPVAKKAPAEKSKVNTIDQHIVALKGMDRQEQKDYLRKLPDDKIDSLLERVNGKRLDDDKRDDLETEIIRQLGKDDSKDVTAEERRKDQEKAQKLREISHGGGKKTVIARKQQQEKAPEKKAEPEKKAAPEKKTPVKKAVAKKEPVAKEPERKATEADRKELAQRRQELKQMNALIADSEKRGGEGSKRHNELLDEREAIQSDIDELEARIGGEKKPPVKKAAPEKKTVAKKTTTVTVKKTGVAKEHKLTPAQEKALKALGDNRNAKVHPATKKVLQREELLDENGHLTDKGAKAAGLTGLKRLMKGGMGGGPEKAPEKKTTVAKKTPVAKKSGQEHADTIKGLGSKDEVDAYLKGLTGPELRETLKAQDRKPEGRLVGDLRKQISDDWGMGHKLKEAQGPEKKAAPEKKTTTVVKKTPVAKETPEQTAQRVAKELADAETREDAERIVDGLKGAHLREVEANVGVTAKGTVAQRKARLVDATMIRKGVKAPDKEQAARDRQERLDAGGAVGGLVAEVEQLVDSDVDGRVLVRRISSYQIRAHGKPGSDKVDALAAKIATGKSNEERLRLAREGLAEHGVKLTGAAGAEEAFDPAKHESIGGSITKGQKVAVIRPGYTVHEGGTDVQVAKAKVEPISEKGNVRKAAIAEHIAFLKKTDDRAAITERIKDLPKKDLREIAEKLGVEGIDDRETAADLRNDIRNHVESRISQGLFKRRAGARQMVMDLRTDQKIALDKVRKAQRPPDSGRPNPDVLRDPPGFRPQDTHVSWWTGMHADTGPDGIPARDVSIAAGHSAFDIEPYTVKKGTVFRFDGVTYMIEDGAGIGSARVTVEQLRKFHESLPPSVAKYQKAYVVARRDNPADSYWQKRFNSPGHKSIASAGDGSTRVWQGGFTGGKYPKDEGELFGHLQHEFGHNAGKSPEAHDHDADDDSRGWLQAAEQDSTEQARAKIPQGIEWVIPYGSFAPEIHSEPPTTERAFRHGVSSYGKSSQHEDYAESTFQYLTGPIGVVHRDGKSVPIYFRDVFPRRAHLLDLLYPDVAKIQKAQVAKRGAVPA